MYDAAISHGCEHLGVRFMNDTIPLTLQNKINDKADDIFAEAQKKFENFLKKQGCEWEMGVIRNKDIPSCFGEPLCYHNRAENGCYDCPFSKRCDAARKEND